MRQDPHLRCSAIKIKCTYATLLAALYGGKVSTRYMNQEFGRLQAELIAHHAWPRTHRPNSVTQPCGCITMWPKDSRIPGPGVLPAALRPKVEAEIGPGPAKAAENNIVSLRDKRRRRRRP